MNQSAFLTLCVMMLIALFWVLATHPGWISNALAFVALGAIALPVVLLLVAFLGK